MSLFRWTEPQPRPSKGTALLERRESRAKVKANEKTEKAKVVARDGSHTCRLVPNCPEKEKHETAHLENKGAGGDHGLRTTADTMVRACLFHHQGRWSLHSGDLRVEYLTPEKANGPIEVWGKDETGREFMVKREIACGQIERD